MNKYVSTNTLLCTEINLQQTKMKLLPSYFYTGYFTYLNSLITDNVENGNKLITFSVSALNCSTSTDSVVKLKLSFST